MIMRIFQVVTRLGKEQEFGKFFHETAIPLMKGTKGIVQVLSGAPRPDSPREFSFVMVWDSLEFLERVRWRRLSEPAHRSGRG